ncbi:MAG: hypothetical protein AAGE52_17290 [Myxococcota bacterium]
MHKRLALALLLWPAMVSAQADLADEPAAETDEPSDVPVPMPMSERETHPNADAEADETIQWIPGIETFGAYRLQVVESAGENDREWFHIFELERALLWLGVQYGDLSARIMLEAVQSADEAGLLAIGGDSLVIRVREAWAGYNVRDWVDLRAGMVRTLTQPMVESVERLRPVGKGPHERFNLLYPADVGATAVLRLPHGLGRIGAGVTNGEGYRNREMNRGKTTELFAELRPLATLGAEGLVISGSYILGSEGSGSARADRATVIVAWDDDWLKVGGSFTYALGFEGNGAREGWLAHGFARVELFDRLILGARADHFRRDTDDSEDAITTYQGTVGFRVMEPLETYLSLSRDVPGDRARAALPGSDLWELSLLIRLRVEGLP